MKVPLKPFTVEVKRSRSNSSAPKPAANEPPVLIEAKPAPVQISVSQARQLAEQIFASLTSPPSAERAILETAENLFRVPEPVEVVAEVLDRGPRVTNQQVPVARETRVVKPRKPRASKVPTLPAAPEKPPKARTSAKAAIRPPASDKSMVRPRILDRPVVPLKVEPLRPQPASHSLELPLPKHSVPSLASQDQGWGPGERWKRRLRYLR